MSLCRLKSELGWKNLLVFFVLTPGRHTAYFLEKLPNGLRYPLVGGTRQHHFDGTDFKPRKLPENAQTPTSRVHAVLGAFVCSTHHPRYPVPGTRFSNSGQRYVSCTYSVRLLKKCIKAALPLSAKYAC